MRKAEPRLQRKLLAWLLGPLRRAAGAGHRRRLLDSLRSSNLAYDRALHEIGREIVLHVKLDGAGRGWSCRRPRPTSCCWIQDDLLFYRVVGEDGAAARRRRGDCRPPQRPT